jgi:ribosome biogenesis protein NSA2
MRKLIKQHEEKKQKGTVNESTEEAIPAYLLDRQKQTAGKALSSAIKQKRKEKAVYFFNIIIFIFRTIFRPNIKFRYQK